VVGLLFTVGPRNAWSLIPPGPEAATSTYSHVTPGAASPQPNGMTRRPTSPGPSSTARGTAICSGVLGCQKPVDIASVLTNTRRRASTQLCKNTDNAPGCTP
jgi:hypothetical protein